MGITKSILQVTRKYHPCLPRKRLCLIFATVLFLSIMLFFTFNIHYLCSLSFTLFDDLSKQLNSQLVGGHSPHNIVCSHYYENYYSDEEIKVDRNIDDLALEEISNSVSRGGTWVPTTCFSKYRVNIVVPYRRRQEQLKIFLNHIHRYLQIQQIEYRIIIVEQTSDKDFNRGKLLNVGFLEAQKRFPSDCYIFHDVDLIPLSLNNMFACTEMPRHLSSAIDLFDFKLPYCELFGGAVAISKKHFELVNGFSNMFYGWGGEDDDFYFRINQAGLSIIRLEQRVAKYLMLNHSKESPNPKRFQLLKTSNLRLSADGLTSLDHSLVRFELKPLYTWFLINV